MNCARLAFLVIVALVVVACGAQPVATHGEVAWFDGGVDDALLLAKQTNKPLFLYWGAEWCPPCNELKTKIFQRPEFVAKMEEFVPVYLDGDTESAQIEGERLGFSGYPTVILIRPDGQEMMRMPQDVTPRRYVQLLDAALTEMQPIGAILEEVLAAGAENAAPADLDLLAHYSWGRDPIPELDGTARVATFRELWERTPEELRLERSRFLTLWVDAAVEETASDDDGSVVVSPMPDEERAALRQAVVALLEDPDLRAANLSFVSHAADQTIGLLWPEASDDREKPVATWRGAARALEEDSSLTVDERLSAIKAHIALARLDAPNTAETDADLASLPDPLIDHIRERIIWATTAVSDDHEMQAVMYTMAALLEEAGLVDEAEILLTERLEEAVAPYYFMSWIADIKLEAEQTEEALEWYRKAYDSARGRYTRFRWGSIYLRKVLDLAPGQKQTIEADSMEVLDELLSFDDAFAGGNYMRLGQLEAAYQDWNEEGRHDETLGRIRDRVHAVCDDYPGAGEDSQRERCESFLIESTSSG